MPTAKTAPKIPTVEEVRAAFKAARDPDCYDLRIGCIEGPPDLHTPHSRTWISQAEEFLARKINSLRDGSRGRGKIVYANYSLGVGLQRLGESEGVVAFSHDFAIDPTTGECLPSRWIPTDTVERAFYAVAYGAGLESFIEIAAQAGALFLPEKYPMSETSAFTPGLSQYLLWCRMLFDASKTSTGKLGTATRHDKEGDYEIAFWNLDPFLTSLLFIDEYQAALTVSADPITYQGFAILVGGQARTVRNKMSDTDEKERPRLLSKSGKYAVFSYRELREWYIRCWEKGAESKLPSDYRAAMELIKDNSVHLGY